MNKAFTLIETVIAIFLITAGTTGAFALVQRTITFTAISAARLQAAYLAQEGVEIIRNIRDTNYLELEPWDSGLTGCSAGCEADYNDTVLAGYTGRFLKIDGNLYSYDAGTDTHYQRKITISSQSGILNVAVQVLWQERDQPYEVSAQTKLYDWR